MTSPGHGDVLCSTERAIDIAGFVTGPGVRVYVEGSADGVSFAPIATAISAASPFTTTSDGTTLYLWSLHQRLTDWSPDDRGMRASHVRAYILVPIGRSTLRADLVFFDNRDIDRTNQDWIGCILAQQRAGATTPVAANACKSSAIPSDDYRNAHPDMPLPSAEVRAPTRSVCECPTLEADSVTITTTGEASTWRCLRAVHGDLTIRAGTDDVTLPLLRSVGGRLRIDYTRSAPPPILPFATVELPNLVSVGGSVELGGNVGMVVALGLPHLNAIGGNLTMHFGVGATTSPYGFAGLGALRDLAHDLDVQLDWPGDTNGIDLLKNLRHVGGSVRIQGFNTLYGWVSSLESIDRDLTVIGLRGDYARPDDPGFGALVQVGGTARFTDAPFGRFPVPRLQTAGRFVLKRSGTIHFDSALVAVDELEIVGNPELVDLRSTPAWVARSLRIRDNRQLSACDVTALVNARHAANPALTADVGGNRVCP
jgi:hypothetical protein